MVGQGSYDGNPGRVYVLQQQNDHTFKDISVLLNLVRYPFRPANRIRTCDFDLDGDEDFFMSGGTTNELFILQNNIGNRSSYIGFQLDGREISNRSAVGAKITLHTSKGIQTREIYAGQGNASGQGPFTVYFGIGNSKVDSVKFVWPDKQNTTWSAAQPDVNKIHFIDKSSLKRTEPSDASLVGIYPNPANQTIQFLIRNADRADLKLEIWTSTGQKLFSLKAADVDDGLDISQLASGIYFLKVSKGKQTQSIRFLKY